jgi:hypothetical protein
MADVQLYRDPKTGTYYKRDGNDFIATDATAAETGAGEALLVGAGKSFADLATGAKMRAAQTFGDVGAYSRLVLDQARADDALAPLQREHGAAMVAGGVLPYLAVPIGGAGPVASIGAGAALGALSPEADPASAMYMGAAGGGLAWGAAAATRAARVGGRPGSMAERVQARIQGEADDMAMPARPGVPTGEFSQPMGLDDLSAAGQRQGLADAVAVRQGVRPEVASAERIRELGYDPALLGGRAPRYAGDIHADAAKTLQSAGFELTPGELQNNRALLRLEAAAESTPWSSAPFDAIRSKNQGKFNDLVAKAIGIEDASLNGKLSGEMLNAARDNVSNLYNKAIEAIRGERDFGGAKIGGLRAKLDDIAAEYKNYGIEVPTKWLDAAELASAKGTADPLGLLAARQRLSGLASSEFRTGRTIHGEALRDVVDAIDEALAAASKSQAPGIERGREITRVLRTLDRPGVWKETGDVAAGPMYRALKQGFRSEIRQRWTPGTAEEMTKAGRRVPSPEVQRLVNVIRAREAAIPSFIRDSGTATRMSLQTLIANPVRTVAEQTLGRGLAMGYLGIGKAAPRALSGRGAEQLSGIWGSTW